jgi:2-polyprenyl-3-methyl-5-hydroxy-6-metoxy-1,4-benzoquinol methylase
MSGKFDQDRLDAPEPCDICGEKNWKSYLRISLCGVFDAEVHQCLACKFRQIRPRISRGELEDLYPQDYFDSGSEIGYEDYAKHEQKEERTAYFLSKRMNQYSQTGHLLDVGSGLGFLLKGLRRFTKWELHGIDVSRFACFFAEKKYGLNVKSGTLEEVNFPTSTFDFVIQKDLLEHVCYPAGHLIETNRIMRSGGILYLVTPNGDANLELLSDQAKVLEHTGHSELPFLGHGHLSFFTAENLNTLFSQSGFEVIKMRNLDIRRRLRTFRYFPKKRRLKTVSGGKSRFHRTNEPPKSESISESEANFPKLYHRIDTRLTKVRKGFRSSIPYFYFRRFQRWTDLLPAAFPLGTDFEFLLRKK